jgi:hypothetical protein
MHKTREEPGGQRTLSGGANRFLQVAAPSILPTMPPDFREVDPNDLRVPPSRSTGADPAKLQRQIAQFGASVVGMPPLWVYEAADGVLVVYDGVTRATRITKLAPGTLVRVEVIGKLRRAYSKSTKIGDLLP